MKAPGHGFDGERLAEVFQHVVVSIPNSLDLFPVPIAPTGAAQGDDGFALHQVQQLHALHGAVLAPFLFRQVVQLGEEGAVPKAAGEEQAPAAGLEQLIQAVGQQLAVGRAPKAGQRGEGGRSVQLHSDELNFCFAAFHPMHPQAGGDEQNVLGIQVQDLSLLQIELKAPSLAKQQADRTTEGIRQPGIPLAAGQLADL